MQNKNNERSVETRNQIIQHDSESQGNSFNIADRKRLHDIEEPEKQKSYQQQEKTWMLEYQPESQELPHNFIDHHLRWILPAK